MIAFGNLKFIKNEYIFDSRFGYIINTKLRTFSENIKKKFETKFE